MAKPPTDRDTRPAPGAARADIDAFLAKARDLAQSRPGAAAGTRGRLIFALDATMSRQPTWDIACALQAEMFREAGAIGGLDIQLVYYRGFGECRASRWVSDGGQLATLMQKIDCRGGHTQIGKVLSHTRAESNRAKVQALVFVGDAMEESLDDLAAKAGELGLLSVPAFVFQEGDDPIAAQAFREIARLTNGAYCRFSPGSAHELAELLRAVAAYAAGGLKALQSAQPTRGTQMLLQQLR
jgi:hypothetical protein